MFNKKIETISAFTLAEVLITLAIIGIVAALTIPTLINNYQKSQYVTGYKKAFSMWAQTAIKMANDSGCPGNLACFFDSTSAQVMGPKIIPYFKVVKTCASGETGCFASTSYMNYDHTNPTTTLGTTSDYYNYQFVTADGMSVAIDYPYVACGTDLSGIPGSNSRKTCLDVWVDSNGVKPPNTLGRDLFRFFITNGKGPAVYPYGGSEYSHWLENGCNKGVGSGASVAGFSCAGRVIEEGWQMNY